MTLHGIFDKLAARLSINSFELQLTLASLTVLALFATVFKSIRAGSSFWSALGSGILVGAFVSLAGVGFLLGLQRVTEVLGKRMVSGEQRQRLEAEHGREWLPRWLAENPAGGDRVRNLVVLFGLVLSVISASLYFFGNPTAYEYPSIDMGPYFERAADATFLLNDFFTNASSTPSPRQVFGVFVRTLSFAFGTDWYIILFFLKSFFIMSVPALFYWFIVSRLFNFFDDETGKIKVATFTFLGTLGIFSSRVVGLFSPAWWQPIFYYAAPQTLALVFALSAGLLAGSGSRRLRLASLPIWTLATLVHLQIGLYVFIFLVLSAARIKVRTLWHVAAAATVLPLVVLVLVFGSVGETLSSAEFVQYYVKDAHSAHYLPSDFGSLTSFPWYLSFAFAALALLALSVFIWLRGNREVAAVGVRLTAAYVGCVALQYVFVEVWLLKYVAIFGPSRYLMFGFWSFLFLAALSAASHAREIQSTMLLARSGLVRSRLTYFIAVVLALAVLSISALVIDNPKDRADRGLLEWIAETPTESVFIVPPGTGLPTDMRLLYRRALFVGGGFPFNEGEFREQDRRNSLVYGSYDELALLPGKELFDRTSDFYRSKGPEYWAELVSQEKVDYVVIESAFSAPFQSLDPEYDDGNIKIYAAGDLSGLILPKANNDI